MSEPVEIRTREQLENVLESRSALVVTDKPERTATFHTSPQDCSHVGEETFATKVLENGGKHGGYFTVTSLADAEATWPELRVCGWCGVASITDDQLKRLLGEVVGFPTKPRAERPAGAEFKFEKGSWPTTQRIALGRIDGAMVIRTWPAEDIPQSKALYGTGVAAGLVALATGPTDWIARPNPHLAFSTSNPQERFYFRTPMTLPEYVAAWSRPEDLAAVHQYKREEVTTSLWPWLCERGYAAAEDPENRAGLELYMEQLRRRSFPPLLRPGIQMEWACESTGREDLAIEVHEAVRILARALGGSLPDGDGVAGA
jgi:hypothetical protein